MPKMENHESQVSTHHGYDDRTGEMHLTFKSGETHAFKVPKETYNQFVSEGSKGRFFNQNLRNLPFRRVKSGANG